MTSGLDEKDRRWGQLTKTAALVILIFYCTVPFEGGGERFPLLFRLACMVLLAGFLFVGGGVKVSEAAVVSLPILFFSLILVLANLGDIGFRLINAVLIIAIAGYVFLLCNSSEIRRAQFAKALDFVILLSGGALFAQFFIYIGTGELIELHGIVFPWGQSRSVVLEGFGIARFAGLYTEPGTHSNWVLAFILLRTVLTGKLLGVATIVGVSSILITMSAWGLGAVAAFLSSVFIFQFFVAKKVDKWLLFVLVGVFLMAVLVLTSGLFDAALDYFRYRSELDNESGWSKVSAWYYGLGALENIAFLGLPIGSDYCFGCQSPQDAGLILNFSIYFGFLAAILFFGSLIVAVSLRIGFYVIPLVLVFFVGKYYYFDPVVWFVWYFAIGRIFVLRPAGGSTSL